MASERKVEVTFSPIRPGAWFVTCERCGAAVLIDYYNPVDERELHRRWHEEAADGR